ncbi:MAG: hypothetical protein LBT36_05785, partial [Oscillospiraceae bacterium]|nr:hypothetical protein [Oscillospiraceae bacterium]
MPKRGGTHRRGIYEQSLRTDYKYFDDPEFYNSGEVLINGAPRATLGAEVTREFSEDGVMLSA